MSTTTAQNLNVIVSAKDRATGVLQSVAGSMKKLSVVAPVAGAAIAAAIGGKAVQAAAQFEEQMIELEKVTNPETAREMGSAIQEMAGEMPAAHKELAKIAADAGRFGIEGTENIKAFTETVSKMATATNVSANEAGKALAKISTLTGLSAKDANELGSAINALSNNFATSSQEIVDSMTRSSAALSQLGLNASEISSLSATLNEVSSSSRRAGTRLRRLAQEMMSPKKIGDLASALGMTREEFKEMRNESPNQMIEEMAEAFNEGGETADLLRSTLSTTSRQALSGLAQNLDALSDAQEMSNSQMEEGTSLQKEYEAASSTLMSQWNMLMDTMRSSAISMGQNLLPVVKDFVKWLRKSLIPSINQFKQNILDAVKPIMSGLIPAFIRFKGQATGALKSIIGVAKELFMNNLKNYMSFLKQAVLPQIKRLSKIVINDVVPTLKDWGKTIGSILVPVTKNFYNTLFSVYTEVLEPIFELVKNKLIGAWKELKNVVSSSTKWFQSLGLTSNKVINAFKTLFDVIKPIALFIGEVFLKYSQMYYATLEGIYELTKTFVSTLIQGLQPAFDAILKALKPLIGAVSNSKTQVKGAEDAANQWKQMLVDLKPIIKMVANVLADILVTSVRGTIETFKTLYNWAKDVYNALNDVANTIGNVSSNAAEIGDSITDKIPFMASGGVIEQEGLAYLHRGETVVPAELSNPAKKETINNRTSKSSSSKTIIRELNIEIDGRDKDEKEIAMEVKRIMERSRRKRGKGYATKAG